MLKDNCPFKLNMEFNPGVKVNDDLYFYSFDFAFFPFKPKLDMVPKESLKWIREKQITILQA